MNRAYHNWYSSNLQRNMELLVFGQSGTAVLLFPTRMARFYDYENWGIVEALRPRIDNGELQLFCVDSIDAESFYNQWAHPAQRINRHLQYEQYIMQEVIALMQAENKGDDFEVAGCSMGAYHALNIAMKHPSLFKRAVGLSGRYDLTKPIYDFKDLFDGYHNDDIYFNSPAQFVANMHEGANMDAIRRLTIIMAVGETDPFLSANQDFHQLLWNKGIPNQLYIWDNYAHRPRYWRKMVQLYL